MKVFFKRLIADTSAAVGRFLAAFACTLGLFSTVVYFIFTESRYDSPVYKTAERTALTFAFGFLLCIFGILVYERLEKRFSVWRLWVQIGLLGVSSILYPLLLLESVYTDGAYMGLMLALFVAIVYLSTTRRNISTTFLHLFKHIVFCAIVSSVVLAGISLCIFAFDSLIYSFDYRVRSNIYSTCSAFIYIVLFLNLCLAGVPREDAEFRIPRSLKIVILFAALPVYLLLIAILLAYLGKIAITMKFPSGQINWFVSSASALFVFFVLSLRHYEKESNLARLFVRFGGFVMLPLILVQFWAIGIRVSSYGITSARYVSIVANLWALGFVIVSIIRSGIYLRQTFLAVIGLSLLLTCTPLNWLDVPLWEQTSRLNSVLSRNGMISEWGDIVPNDKVPAEDREAIKSAYDYLRYLPDEKIPGFISKTNDLKFEEIFGFPRYELTYPKISYATYEYSYDYSSRGGIDVEGYSRVYAIERFAVTYESEPIDLVFDFEFAGLSTLIDITKLVDTLIASEIESEPEGSDSIPIEMDVGDNKLLIVYLYVSTEDESVTYCHFEGYLLVR